jgi:DNA-binding response OmpR family regulator
MARAESPGPKVILLDLKPPKVDGIEVPRKCLTSRPDDPVTTARAKSAMSWIRINLGQNSYIVKPVDFEQFTGAVAQLGLYWLSEHPRRSEALPA